MEEIKKQKAIRGTYAVNENDAAVVAEYLRKRGTPVPLKDIVTATGTIIKYQPLAPTSQLTRMMELDKRIVKVKYGVYAYQSISDSASAPAPAPTNAIPLPDVDSSLIGKAEEMKKLSYNQEVDAIVTAIHQYGVFAQLVDYDLSGLIHVSRVSRGRYYFAEADLEKHFRIGDKIKVKAQEVRDGKLALSTFDMKLPDYSMNPLSAKLEPVKAKITAYTTPTPAPIVTAPSPAPIVAPKSVAPVTARPEPTHAPYGHMADKRELETLNEMVKNKVGMISEAAKIQLRDEVMRLGMVKVTMAIMNATDYQADVSLAFIRHVAMKANGGL